MAAAAHMIEGRVAAVYVAPGGDIASVSQPQLHLTYEGVPGDRHAGLTRKSGGREPWYARGTPMRNERQLSIVSAEELAEVATALGVAALPAEWIGANLLFGGIPQLSRLPPRSILMFPSGAAIRIDGDNGPCRGSGRSIALQTGVAKHEFDFVQVAKGKRGLVGWVEREGVVSPGDIVKIRIWTQADYAG
jgi:hypothetical protein